MSKTLTEIAQELKDTNKKVQLIYAFNGTGKTRLSREFKQLISPQNNDGEDSPHHSELSNKKILYYSAFTEDLFYWDNDLSGDAEYKLKILQNSFTNWVFINQGLENNVTKIFQQYTSERLTSYFNHDFSKASFSYRCHGGEYKHNIKISKGEESNFVWSIFYSLFKGVVDVLNVDVAERETSDFNNLEYVFIDDPVSSLDDNHLIQLAVDLAVVIKSSESNLKFIITTHNPLFFNVLSNEFNNKSESGYNRDHHKKYLLEKLDADLFALNVQRKDSPFSYHLHLLSELDKAIESGELKKYHFNFIRNILEKTSTFLGYEEWKDLLIDMSENSREHYFNRVINLSSHSKHAGEEITMLSNDDCQDLKELVEMLRSKYKFNNIQ